jgi:hypothetical protein
MRLAAGTALSRLLAEGVAHSSHNILNVIFINPSHASTPKTKQNKHINVKTRNAMEIITQAAFLARSAFADTHGCPRSSYLAVPSRPPLCTVVR